MGVKGKPRSTAHRKKGILGPGADQAFRKLAAPEIRQRVVVAHLVTKGREAIQQHIGRPAGRVLLRRWLKNKSLSHQVEAFGLPRHIVEEVLGEDALTLHVDPRKLIRIAVYASRHLEKRPSSMAFIWDGTWDQRREDLRVGTRYRLISEIDEHRHELERTERYQELMECIERGAPWSSHQLGVVLDTPERIIDYLKVYVTFLDDMAANGFDADRGKDPIGVAISREGTILKVNRGLHRLAMAQRLGVPSIPVRVRHVHRLWWNEVTGGTQGAAALEKMQAALQHCVPDERPGPLDEDPEIEFPENFWPAPRYPDKVPTL